MTGGNCLAALFATSGEIEEAVQKLERAGYDLNLAVSVLGRLFRPDAEPDGKARKSRQPSNRWCRKFDDFALFPNTGIGQIVVCGPMVNGMLDALTCGEGSDALPALATALAAAGFPERGIGRYETALARGHILLLLKDSPSRVDRAAQVLATGREIELAVHQGRNGPFHLNCPSPVANSDNGDHI